MAENSHHVDPIVAQLRDIRLSANIKQKDIANLIGVGPSNLSAYEVGSNVPRIDTVQDWSTALDMQLVLAPADSTTKSRIGRKQPVDDGTTVVRLTRYQIALAVGMLLSTAHATSSEKLSKEITEICDSLARSLDS